MKKLPSILFMGSPEIARVILEALHRAAYPIVMVMTQPDKPAGRGRSLTPCACATYARDNQLELYQPPSVKEEEVIAKIENLKPDFIVVAAYGKLLPERVLQASGVATLNLHASLLPAYRGAAPINWSIIDGKKQTGITLMQVTLKMDSGPVYAQIVVDIADDDTALTLTQKLSVAGAELLLQSLPLIEVGELKPVPQDESLATHARLLKKEDGHIDWRRSANEIHCQIRGLNPWPVAFTFLDSRPLKIYGSHVVSDCVEFPAGTIYLTSQEGIHVSCGEGALCLTELQLEGKKRLPAKEFVNGYRIKAGTVFQF